MLLARLAPPLFAGLLLTACSSKTEPITPTDAGPDAGTALPWSHDDVPKLPQDDVLRVHHLQAKGTHNSYHIETPGNTLVDWHYTMPPLDQQLSVEGVRQIELDLHLDSLESDFEILHLKSLDEMTTCKTLRECLTVIGTWSGAHPGHLPLYLQFEAKNGYTPEDAEGFFSKLHAEILAVLVRERLVTPDEVQGDATTLGEAVAAKGWPTLTQTRGRIILAFDNSSEVRDAYTRGGTSLKGRLFFTDAAPGDATAAIAILNDPTGEAKAIGAALAANMMVRTMSDDPKDDDTKAEAGLAAALKVGATWISTNFPAEVEGRTFVPNIPEGTPARCNPITAPASCTAKDIEDLKP
ncbi:MAG: Ca2+-dependent phosphoinositide-specific phospholipase C [Minicystis sp.]